jgi:hypothetical protein
MFYRFSAHLVSIRSTAECLAEKFLSMRSFLLKGLTLPGIFWPMAKSCLFIISSTLAYLFCYMMREALASSAKMGLRMNAEMSYFWLRDPVVYLLSGSLTFLLFLLLVLLGSCLGYWFLVNMPKKPGDSGADYLFWDYC